SAVYDKVTKQYIVKIVNTGDNAQQISLNFKGAKKLGEGIVTTFHADDMKATNSLDNPKNVVPQQSSMQANGDNATVTVPAKTFAVYKF
ncbi:MAG: alpha-L-arabinofuranosidase, partial [Massilibacteroides sp.]|nr:alpha-L-arabinofuranosidase [Massilibacteroides sp.]